MIISEYLKEINFSHITIYLYLYWICKSKKSIKRGDCDRFNLQRILSQKFGKNRTSMIGNYSYGVCCFWNFKSFSNKRFSNLTYKKLANHPLQAEHQHLCYFFVQIVYYPLIFCGIKILKIILPKSKRKVYSSIKEEVFLLVKAYQFLFFRLLWNTSV